MQEGLFFEGVRQEGLQFVENFWATLAHMGLEPELVARGRVCMRSMRLQL